MKRMICASTALLLLLSGCTVPTPERLPTESFTYGIYDFSFSVEQLSGEPTDAWEFIYTYNEETITTGHQIRFSLEIFTFHSIQVTVIEKDAPGNQYSATFAVAICDGGTGKTEVRVIGNDGKIASFRIACQVNRIS